MANIPLKSIKFPDLADTYTVPSNAGELPYDKNATYPADTVGKALQDKPNADGTIANAEQLTSNIYEEDNTPYNFRTSGGSIDIGDRETDMLVGGTVGWNQLIENGNFATDSLWSTSNATKVISDGICTFTASAKYGYVLSYGRKFPSTPNQHVYIAMVDIKLTTGTTNVCLRLNGGYKQKFTEATTNWQTVNAVYKCYNGDNGYYQIIDMRESGWDAIQVRNAMLIDLTVLLGSTIADYIYSLEQSSAGAGIAWFKKLFPKPYYAYNAGELMSVQASSHDMVGFNEWDILTDNIGKTIGYDGTLGNNSNFNTSDYIRVLPSTTYYFKNVAPSANALTLAQYDSDKNFIKTTSISGQSGEDTSGLVTMESNTHYIRCQRFANTTEVCINLSWDGERDGEYEPYVKHEYALDSSLTLRGIPKLNASNNLYYDGDTYESDGTVTRKYGVVDLGTLDWVYNSTALLFRTGLTDGIKVENAEIHCVCQKYRAVVGYNPTGGINDTTQDKVISVGSSYESTNNNLLIRDTSYTDATTFKTAMSGVYLVYELATPTTETADPYTNPQIVNDFGTEEYVDYAVSQGDRDVSIPVGHETQYMANLKAKLEMSPNSPEGAGDYIVRQTNGENEYVTLASNATIQDIIARLEALENAES